MCSMILDGAIVVSVIQSVSVYTHQLAQCKVMLTLELQAL